jgi:Fe-S-cluster-containing dehydrogenase component
VSGGGATAGGGLRPAFTFDANRCTGCDACRLACTIENDLPWDVSWRQVLTYNPGRHPAAPLFHLSLACNHCERPLCLEACPALAYRRDATGAVLIDTASCIGCGYCAWACPYDAPRLDERAGVMTKCTFCAHRLAEGRAPACASVCPTGALSFARLPASELVQPLEGFADQGLGPSIRITALREGRAIPAGVGEGPAALYQPPPPGPNAPLAASGVPGLPAGPEPPRRVTLSHEWSLLAFSFGASVLVALAARAAFGWGALPLPGFLAAAAAAMALGGAHLGRKARAWRAILNLRSSWLSREIAAFGLFVAAFTAWSLAGGRARDGGALAVLASGALLLFAIDRVYAVARLPGWARPHSGAVTFIAPFLLGVFAARREVALAAGLVQFALYLRRYHGTAYAGLPTRPALSGLRLGLGFVLPFVVWDAFESWAPAAVIGGALAGALADRLEFYLDLEFRSPQRQLAVDLARRLARERSAGERRAA